MTELNVEKVQNLSGGRNSNDSPLLIRSDQSPDDLNLVGKRYGAIEKRDGSLRVFGSSVSGEPVLGATAFYKSDGRRYVVFATAAALWSWDLANQQLSRIDTGFFPCQPFSFAAMNDWLYCSNMADIALRWDGDNLKTVGLVAPVVVSGGPTATAGLGYLSAGTYYYAFTSNYGRLGESNLNDTAITVVAAANDRMDFNQYAGPLMLTLPEEATGVRVYRTRVGVVANPAERIYYLVGTGTLDANGALDFSDDVADNDLEDEYAGNRVTPLNAAFICRHVNRMWYANLMERTGETSYNSDLGYSELYHPDIWGDSADDPGILRVAAGDGDVITAIRPLRGDLVVFKRHHIYRISGQSLLNFDIIDTHSDVGCIAPRSVAEVNNKLYFLSERGVHFFDGSGVTRVSDKIDSDLRALSETALVWATGWEFRNRYYLSVASNG